MLRAGHNVGDFMRRFRRCRRRRRASHCFLLQRPPAAAWKTMPFSCYVCCTFSFLLLHMFCV